MESFQRRERMKLKQELAEKHFLAKDIGQYINLMLNGSENSSIMELWEFFPDLFEDEEKEAGMRRQEYQTELYKAQMTDYAYSHNNRNGGGK